MSEHFDDVIVGSGQAGGPLARALAGHGRRVAVVERAHVGGTCVNEGCTPTKTMVASARVAHLARRAADYGVRVGEVSVDLARVRERKRAMVERFRSGSEAGLEGADGLELIRGEARFVGPRRLEVRGADGGSRTLTGERVFLNTGTRPRLPDLPGLARSPHLTNADVMELDAVPEHLLVLGGGYIGVEFAQMFRRFGSRVSLVQRGPRLLPREDEEISEAVAEILREDGVALWLSADAAGVRPDGGGVALEIRDDAGAHTLRGSHLLVAVGRTPNTEALDLARAGITPDRLGFVPVDAHLRTAAPGVYALGDVNGGPAFTHVSYDDFRVLRRALVEGEEGAGTRDRLIPYTVFLDPQLGRVGLTEREARERGHEVRVARMPMDAVARALETDETRGLMKAVVDAPTGRILGAAVLGVEGGEVMTVLQMAMLAGLPYTAVRDAMFAHPLLAESLNSLFSAWT